MTDPLHLPLLSVQGLSMRFGGILALNNVNFEVKRHSITALIGPNGAGKTTVFNCITGFYQATEGNIQLHRRGGTVEIGKILGEACVASDFLNPVRLSDRLYYKIWGGSYQVARAGIARTFQNIRLFNDMTVLENLLVAQHRLVKTNLLSGLFNTKAYRRAEEAAIERSYDWLKVFGLAASANRLAGELPYGHQRRLEIARAMCTEPLMICLDEPAAGLNPNETRELVELIRLLRDEHEVTIVLIEHDMSLVMDISEHIIVLDYGEVIAEGGPAAIKTNPLVLAAYLGVDEEEPA